MQYCPRVYFSQADVTEVVQADNERQEKNKSIGSNCTHFIKEVTPLV